ncbi:aldo/keto reductase [Lederbergia ruris]|uniref:aldo/keto reductase n=1 Tax=Lederbergia ruris TaxID=217495 RepID=UPI0039A152D4
MKQTYINSTELKISEICMGTHFFGGEKKIKSNSPLDQVYKETIYAALEGGINFFDTADIYGYGHSERILGETLSSTLEGEKCVIATKVGRRFNGRAECNDFSPKYIRNACKDSLKRLRREKIDIYYLHNAPSEVIGNLEVQNCLIELQREGMVRIIGASVVDLKSAVIAIKSGLYKVIQLPYNILQQNMLPPLIKIAERYNVHLICREVLASGILSGKYSLVHKFPSSDYRSQIPRDILYAQVIATAKMRFLEKQGCRTMTQASLRFVLDHPNVTAAIIGCKNPQQLQECLKASKQESLSVAEIRKIYEMLFLSNYN